MVMIVFPIFSLFVISSKYNFFLIFFTSMQEKANEIFTEYLGGDEDAQMAEAEILTQVIREERYGKVLG